MRLLKICLFLCIFVLFTSYVYAANLTAAYDWLGKRANSDVVSASLGGLALAENGEGGEQIKFIKNQMSSKGCWPKEDCKIMDTALATLFLHKMGESIGLSTDWLLSKQTTSLNGEWILQINTEGSGKCDVHFTKANKPVSKDIDVEKGGFIKSAKCPDYTDEFNLGDCLETNLLKDEKGIVFDISCQLTDATISYYYKEGHEYYLIDELSYSPSIQIKINNADFGVYEDTLYVNWLLKEIGSDVNSLVFLKKGYKLNNVVHNSLNYLIREDELFLNQLAILQGASGDFGGNVFNTGLAALAFRRSDKFAINLDSIKSWADSRQLKDGSWGTNAKDTAIILYGIYGTDSFSTSSKVSFCGDSICDLDESSTSCPQDCRTTTVTPTCGDGICEVGESAICAVDCGTTGIEPPAFCGNNIKEGTEKCDGTDDLACLGECDEFCSCPIEEEKSFTTLIITVIILLLLILGGIVFYLKIYKEGKWIFTTRSKPKRNSFDFLTKKKEYPISSQQTRVRGFTTSRKTKIETELEKSLEEAKKLFKK